MIKKQKIKSDKKRKKKREKETGSVYFLKKQNE